MDILALKGLQLVNVWATQNGSAAAISIAADLIDGILGTTGRRQSNEQDGRWVGFSAERLSDLIWTTKVKSEGRPKQ
jgi:hypothetical protein